MPRRRYRLCICSLHSRNFSTPNESTLRYTTGHSAMSCDVRGKRGGSAREPAQPRPHYPLLRPGAPAYWTLLFGSVLSPSEGGRLSGWPCGRRVSSRPHSLKAHSSRSSLSALAHRSPRLYERGCKTCALGICGGLSIQAAAAARRNMAYGHIIHQAPGGSLHS